MLFGRTSTNRPSRFAGEIPGSLLEQSGRSYLDPAPAGEDWDFDQTRPAVSTYREPYRQGAGSYGGGQRWCPPRRRRSPAGCRPPPSGRTAPSPVQRPAHLVYGGSAGWMTALSAAVCGFLPICFAAHLFPLDCVDLT